MCEVILLIYENMTQTAATHTCIATAVISYNQKESGWQLDEIEQYSKKLSAREQLDIRLTIAELTERYPKGCTKETIQDFLEHGAKESPVYHGKYLLTDQTEYYIREMVFLTLRNSPDCQGAIRFYQK